MLDKMTEQFQSSMNPINDLLAKNAKALVQLAEQQTRLFTEIVSDSVAYTKALSEQKDLTGVLDVQKAFMGNIQEKITSASEDTSKLFAEVQATASDAVKPLFNKEKPAASTAKPAK